MPLVMFDLERGRSVEELASLLDVAHEAVLEAFRVPIGDRYQVVNEHAPSHLVVEDTGLGIIRSAKRVIVTVVSRPRPREQKTLFYRLLVTKLESACGIPSSDVMISFIINYDEDWSFGFGKAQFLTGEL